MKYIRMKDGKIYEIVENDGTWTTNQISKDIVEKALSDNKYFKDDIQIIKQADTIEELCDTFVVKGDNWHQEIGLEDAKWNAKQKLDVYGAIWTNRGLIYVAKMNEKGELELL